MARWKLAAPHYLNTPGEEWEYTEQDRTTGRPKRVKFPVPRLLDPKDPISWTKRWGNKDNEDGEIIVCYEGKGDTSDVIFFGDPTPDMIPVDEEAQAISDTFAKRWNFKPENMITDFSQSLIDKFQLEMAKKDSAAPEVPGLAELTSTLAKLVDQNATLIASNRRV